MMGTARKQFHSLNGLRAIAALWVMAFHTSAWSGNAYTSLSLFGETYNTSFLLQAWYGVDLFFVMSGFLLYLAFADGKKLVPTWQPFMSARMWRLGPPYWAQLLLFLMLPLISVEAVRLFTEGSYAWDVVALQALMLHKLPFTPQPMFLNTVCWTLCHEISFYALFPFILIIIRRKGFAAGLGTMLAIALGSRLLLVEVAHYDIGAFMSFVPTRLDQFGFGMLAAHLLSTRPVPKAAEHPLLNPLLLLAALTLYLAQLYFISGQGFDTSASKYGYTIHYAWPTLSSLLAATMLYLLVQETRYTSALFTLKPLLWLGTLSYSFYLWHLPMLYLIQHYVWVPGGYPGQGLLIPCLQAFAVSLPVAAISYFGVELPILRWRARMIQQAKS
jgi:peptidoglycan/LPS O-acetylase OafA/YrhL